MNYLPARERLYAVKRARATGDDTEANRLETEAAAAHDDEFWALKATDEEEEADG